MRRICAVVLFAALCAGPALPVFAAESAPEIPACCRAHGKHRCTMRGIAAMGDTPSQQAVVPKCPFLPSLGWNAVSGPSALFPKTAQSMFALAQSRPVAQAQTKALFRISFSRTRQKRGPPAILL